MHPLQSRLARPLDPLYDAHSRAEAGLSEHHWLAKTRMLDPEKETGAPSREGGELLTDLER